MPEKSWNVIGPENRFSHAQDSCACTRFLSMHKILVHAQESCACTASCACTRFLCVHNNYKSTQGFLPKHVFSRTGSIWKMGRSSDRGISSRGDARLFYFDDFSEKIGFPARGRFHDVPSVFDMLTQFCFLFQKWLRSVWEWSGGIPDLPGPIFKQFPLKSIEIQAF